LKSQAKGQGFFFLVGVIAVQRKIIDALVLTDGC